MVLRPASIEDLALLRHWDQQPHVIASDPNDDWQWETELKESFPWREQLIAEVEGVPIGFMEIIDPAEEESHYWGDVPPNWRAMDIWIGDPEYLGKGHGTQMMQLALERCFADPEVEKVIIDPLESNTRAIRFYQRLGFKPIEQRRFGKDLCLIHHLSRSAWERESANT